MFESIRVKMPHCWKSLTMAQLLQFYFLQVFDGLVEDETVLGKYCGTYTPRITHTSSENQLTVIFVSDYTIVGTGFNATYEIGMPFYHSLLAIIVAANFFNR